MPFLVKYRFNSREFLFFNINYKTVIICNNVLEANISLNLTKNADGFICVFEILNCLQRFYLLFIKKTGFYVVKSCLVIK